jgi:hypothetical protein
MEKKDPTLEEMMMMRRRSNINVHYVKSTSQQII